MAQSYYACTIAVRCGTMIVSLKRSTRRRNLIERTLHMQISLKKTLPTTTFDAPEGNFAAKLVNVGPHQQETNDAVTDCVRFVFELEVPGKRDQFVLAGKNLDPESTKLQKFIERWLGEEFISSSG